jgi:tetratricopeptide (TPR) repeat protein
MKELFFGDCRNGGAILWRLQVLQKACYPFCDAVLTCHGVFLQKGIESMIHKKNLLQAVDIFDEVIRQAPFFAEGYNKRATALYYLRQFQESILDCHRAIELNPLHFGALSGKQTCECLRG